jgi:hypothetical protein
MRVLSVIAQLTLTLTSPDTVRARTPFTVTLDVGVPAGRTMRVEPPPLGEFRTVKVAHLVGRDSTGAAARALGGVWERHEYRYTLLAPSAGRFGFSPFSVSAGSATVKSRALAFVVQPAPEPVRRARVLSAAPVNPDRPVDVHAVASADTVWRGQQLTYSVGVFLDEFARSRLRRNPEFVPPEVRGAISYPLRGAGRATFTRDVGSKQYSAYVFERALFPVAAGELRIPAARLSYALPQGPGYFSREESFTLQAESLTVVVREPPVDGRPGDWRGAVGTLTASSRVDTVRVRMGDPVTLTLRVIGAGNIELLPRPELAVAWGSVVNGTERVSIDSGGPQLRGVKEFDWLVTPRDSGALTVPRIRYPYFDPGRGEYRTVETSAIPVTVTAGALVIAGTTAGDTAAVAAAGGLSVEPFPLVAATVTPPTHRVIALLWGGLLSLAVVLLVIPQDWMRSRTRSVTARDRLGTMPVASDIVGAAALRRVWLTALAERVPQIAASADVLHLERSLRRAGTREASAQRAVQALATLDRAAFGGGPLDAVPPPARLLELLDAIDAETVPSSSLARMATLLLLCAVGLLLSNGTAIAQSSVDEGTTAYRDGRFAEARAAFLSAATRTPDDVAAWRNSGVAAWRLGDTVTAAWAWQRALRLSPRDAAVRSRLADLPTTLAHPEAQVPSVDPILLWWTAVGGALAALLFGALRLGRSQRPPTAIAWTLVVMSALLAAGAVWVQQRLDEPHLAIVLRDAVSRSDPTMTAEPVASVAAGDVLRIVDVRSGWTRVQIDDRSVGWLPEPFVGSLDRRPRSR